MTNRTKQINGVEYPLTEQENTIRDAEEAQALIDKQTEETKKASGKQKLLDLGLDEDEVKALIGA
jgi:hypothetical protein